MTNAQQFDPSLSLYHLMQPEVLADPYPLYHRLQNEAPVYWDAFLHVWVVTRYADVLTVFQTFSADRTPTPETLRMMGLEKLAPLAQVMVKQMLFLDPPAHSRLRGLASSAFTPRHVELLRGHIRQIVEELLDRVAPQGQMDIIADLGFPLPAIITAEMLGVLPDDREQLKNWSADFAEVLGNFQHNPDRAIRVLQSLEGMTDYFTRAVADHRQHPRDDVMSALIMANVDGDQLTDDEIIANCIIIMVGGQETTTNLIGNGMLTLLRHPEALAQLQADPSIMPSAVEELLRYESPSQHTARIVPEDTNFGGITLQKKQAVIAVMGAANRDPDRFPDPDQLDLRRADNRHVAFAWGSHFCFGAPLARIEGQEAFAALLRRFPGMRLDAGPITWRENLGLRGLTALPVSW